MKHALTIALVVGVAGGATAYAQTWPQFRGANSGLRCPIAVGEGKRRIR
jgi:hypothetical protein